MMSMVLAETSVKDCYDWGLKKLTSIKQLPLMTAVSVRTFCFGAVVLGA